MNEDDKRIVDRLRQDVSWLMKRNKRIENAQLKIMQKLTIIERRLSDL